jgi:hypothetical protein
MNVHKARLDALVNEYLAERVSFDEFSRTYSEYYIEEVPPDGLSEDEAEWYCAIHEEAEWTAPAPPPQDQRDGYIFIDQFYGWLQRHVAARRFSGRF